MLSIVRTSAARTARSALWIAMLAQAACTSSTPTQIVLVVDSDLPPRTVLDRIVIEASSTRTPQTTYVFPLGNPTTPELPLTLALFPRGGDVDTDIRVAVYGYAPTGGALISTRANTRFTQGRSQLLHLTLAARCLDADCPAGATCDQTGCRAIEIPGDALPPWPGAPPILEGEACVVEAEVCNQFDDDCDDAIDEGIDRMTDPENCGRCGNRCDDGTCTNGYCAGDRPVEIAAGGAHACIRRENGRVACWGFNLSGQAGGAPLYREAPNDVAGAEDASSLSAGGAHTCFVEGGGVSCFGEGSHGQLGDGTDQDSGSPVGAANLSSIVQVSAGAAHTCAISEDGHAWCWGRNDAGQLGDGTTGSRLVAQEVDADGLTAVSAGVSHTCALREDGTILCWGANDAGQLGTGDRDDSRDPVAVDGIDDALAVGGGRRHSCALRSGGTIACWGANDRGQLGDGTTLDRSSPVAVSGVTGAERLAVAALGNHACAIGAGAQVTCWGSNLDGQLGDRTSDPYTEPVVASGVADTVALALGAQADDGTGFSCALDDLAAVRCWGNGSFLQLGNGSTGTVFPTLVTHLP